MLFSPDSNSGAESNPIGVFDASWTRLDQNSRWTALTGDQRERPERADNLVWRIFSAESGTAAGQLQLLAVIGSQRISTR